MRDSEIKHCQTWREHCYATKAKLSLEEKVKIIQDYLEGTISKSEAARRGGVARDTIEQWARNYESDGEYAFLLHKNRVYSPEIKGKPWRITCPALEVSQRFVRNTIFGNECSSKSGLRCIMLMEISTPQSFLEEEVT